MQWMPHFLPMVTFMFVAAFTPGPNNIMLAASAANFGFWRSFPHMLGVVVGFFSLLMLVGLGLDWVFTQFPIVRQIFRLAALAFIFWLAWRIARSSEQAKSEKRSRPQYFIEATSFQFINPKGVAMSITVTSTFISPEYLFTPQFIALAVSFTFISFASVVAWAGFGVAIRQWIQTPLRLRIFNITMAVLLIASIMPVVRDVLAGL